MRSRSVTAGIHGSLRRNLRWLPVFVQCCHRNGLLCFYGSMKPLLFPMDAAAKAVTARNRPLSQCTGACSAARSFSVRPTRLKKQWQTQSPRRKLLRGLYIVYRKCLRLTSQPALRSFPAVPRRAGSRPSAPRRSGSPGRACPADARRCPLGSPAPCRGNASPW